MGLSGAKEIVQVDKVIYVIQQRSSDKNDMPKNNSLLDESLCNGNDYQKMYLMKLLRDQSNSSDKIMTLLEHDIIAKLLSNSELLEKDDYYLIENLLSDTEGNVITQFIIKQYYNEIEQYKRSLKNTFEDNPKNALISHTIEKQNKTFKDESNRNDIWCCTSPKTNQYKGPLLHSKKLKKQKHKIKVDDVGDWFIFNKKKMKSVNRFNSTGYWKICKEEEINEEINKWMNITYEEQQTTKIHEPPIQLKHLNIILSVCNNYYVSLNENEKQPINMMTNEYTICITIIDTEKEYSYDLYWWNTKSLSEVNAFCLKRSGECFKLRYYIHLPNSHCHLLSWEWYDNDSAIFYKHKLNVRKQMEATFQSNNESNFPLRFFSDKKNHQQYLFNDCRMTEYESEIMKSKSHKSTFILHFSFVSNNISSIEQVSIIRTQGAFSRTVKRVSIISDLWIDEWKKLYSLCTIQQQEMFCENTIKLLPKYMEWLVYAFCRLFVEETIPVNIVKICVNFYQIQTNESKSIMENKKHSKNKMNNIISDQERIDVEVVEDISAEHIIDILYNHVVNENKNDKLIEHKLKIIKYIRSHQICGQKMIDIGRKQFGENIVIYCNDLKLRGPLVKAYTKIIKYKYDTIPLL